MGLGVANNAMLTLSLLYLFDNILLSVYIVLALAVGCNITVNILPDNQINFIDLHKCMS